MHSPKPTKTHKKRFMPFICGSSNTQEDDDFFEIWPSSHPPTPSRTHRHKKKKLADNKNPYSSRGLDKFEALLADLDDKKQKIFTQKGSQYISFVRFVYSNSNDVKPIIVRLQDHPMKLDQHHKRRTFKETKSISLPKMPTSTSITHDKNSDLPGALTKSMVHAKPVVDHGKEDKVRAFQWKEHVKMRLREWWTPSYNLPLFVIMVMVFLTFFGRSLAIICTSIAWYMIPTIDGMVEGTTTKTKKTMTKEISRKVSEDKMVSSSKTFLSGPISVQNKHKIMKKLMSF